jgi:alkanesulfonate monooxygenase SsuD/methylene tetrahydromethanopterin reductase-like flavin-dependent oxidoreductase (luciferase family)
VILGGDAGPRTAADIAEFCDGWMPIAGRHEFVASVEALREAARAAGRDPSDLSLGVFGAPPDLDALHRLADAGVGRAVLAVPSKSPEEVLARLDRYAPLVDELRNA